MTRRLDLRSEEKSQKFDVATVAQTHTQIENYSGTAFVAPIRKRLTLPCKSPPRGDHKYLDENPPDNETWRNDKPAYKDNFFARGEISIYSMYFEPAYTDNDSLGATAYNDNFAFLKKSVQYYLSV
ncbi:hypothetical protein AVEN_188886-1 [Araneus ventricosus]|uniref:Uncharacterized protein n=1 Tax=Araneus ventricosus TaxID=182803 RepID=A0A4Y2WLP5_ARAVE|nr:hypothetical protein AVEN_26990-1 [Araneus ventricosus]GBO37976.1 hypothetical protein AVEN_188886-1 [Araneus ventricosus]